jgi:hypothetical protein
MPLIFCFWFMVAAYVIHVLDESLLGGSFVEKVRQHWWPEYSRTKFFWFNAAYFAIMIASVVLYDHYSHMDGLVLHSAIPPERGCNRGRKLVGRSCHRLARRSVSCVLHSFGEGKKNAGGRWIVVESRIAL